MEIYELKDYKNQFRKLSDKVIECLKNNDFLNDAEYIDKEINQQMAKGSPSIMFYGVYNAGKSSIINALAGEYIAEVGDIPTTAKIQKIIWNGFHLVDTPGIVANDEHTIIAEDEIKRNDVILFVVDDMGTFENAAVASAIVKIIKIGKPIVLVINQKQASTEGANSEDINKLVIPKLVENINREGLNQGVHNIIKKPNFCGIIPVNAEVAYQAKSQYKIKDNEFSLLWNMSGIENLIATIETELKNSSGIKLLIPGVNIVGGCLEKNRKILEAKLKTGLEKVYYESINSIVLKKNNMYKNIIALGKNEMLSYGDQIYASIMKGGLGQDLSQELQTQLNKIIVDGFNNSNIELLNQFELYKANLDSSVSLDFSEISKIRLNIPQREDLNDFESTDFMKYLPLEHIVKNGLAKSVMKMPLKPLNPVAIIPIIGEIVKLFTNKKKEEEYQRELQESVDEYNSKIQANINSKISAIFEINNKIRTEMLKLEESFTKTVEHLIEHAFNKLLKQLEEQFNMEKIETSKVEDGIKEFDEIIDGIRKFQVIFDGK